MQESVVGSRAAKGANQDKLCRAAGQRFGDGQFAIGLVLIDRKFLTVDGGEAPPAGPRGTESKSPTHSSGVNAKGNGVPNTRIRGNDPRPGNLGLGARRWRELAAKENGEGTHWRRSSSGRRKREERMCHASNAACTAGNSRRYQSTRSNGVPEISG